VHVGELGESLRQLVRLGLGEAVVGRVEEIVNSVGVGAVLNGNKVVVGSGEVCDACVVAALRGGTEEIAEYWYGELETCPENVGMGIYLKTSGPGFFDAIFCQRIEVWGRTGQQAARPWCCVEGKESGRGIRLPKQSDDHVLQRPQREVALQ